MADVMQQPSHQPQYIRLQHDEFIETAGLDRSGRSGRKSSVERLLEQSLNTGDNEQLSPNNNHHGYNRSVSPNSLSPTRDETVGVKTTPERPQNLKSDNFIKDAGLSRTGIVARKSSKEWLLEQSLNTGDNEQLSPNNNHHGYNRSVSPNSLSPTRDEMVGVKTTPERPQNLKSDHFIKDAGLSRTGIVARKSSKERLLEDQLRTKEESSESISQPISPIDEGRYLLRPASPKQINSERKTSSSSSGDENASATAKNGRKTSIYEQKQIEAPVATKGNRITARTENLFKQYERDITVHEAKPLANVNNRASSPRTPESDATATSPTGEEKRKVDIAREAKEKELAEVRQMYQQRLEEEEKLEAEERLKRRQNEELKYRKDLGDVKNRYMAIAKGEVSNEAESDDEGLIDEKGDRIEKSGGKIEIVKSGDGVGNIRNRFGNISQSEWKSKNSEGDDTNQVDSGAVNSARSLFKNFESQNQGGQKSFNRPTSRKVRDAKELMDMRKKATYGDEDELPEDGVVKKSIVLDDEELSGTASRREAMNVYVQLQSPKDEKTIIVKPKNRLMSDEDAQNEIYKQSGSSSGSENGDNGYEGSESPCSPTSTMSDDYVSDTLKDHEKSDDFIESSDQVAA